jgi:hypothetical protein
MHTHSEFLSIVSNMQARKKKKENNDVIGTKYLPLFNSD